MRDVHKIINSLHFPNYTAHHIFPTIVSGCLLPGELFLQIIKQIIGHRNHDQGQKQRGKESADGGDGLVAASAKYRIKPHLIGEFGQAKRDKPLLCGIKGSLRIKDAQVAVNPL